MVDPAIEVKGLSKSFGSQTALNGLNLRVPAGSIFGFLGRNGAGKTTTIRMLSSVLKPDAGSIRVFGLPIEERQKAIDARRRTGFVTEEKELYPYMTVEQVIKFTRPFFPKWRRDLEQGYLRALDLPLHKKVPDLSKGMRSKLMLLLAISHEAELLVLDEPTDGLDPVSVEEMLRVLVSLAASGTTVFFSTHQLAEVEQIADHIAIIDHGRSVVAGSLDDLKVRYRRLHIVFAEEPPVPVAWLDGVEHVHHEGRTLSILVSRNAEAVAEQARSLPGTTVECFPVTLRDLFFNHVRGSVECSG